MLARGDRGKGWPRSPTPARHRWYRVSDPNRGDHLAMAAARNGAAVSRGNGPRSAVLAHRPGRYPAHRLASMRPSMPNLRRTVVPRGPEPAHRFPETGTSSGATPSGSGTLLVDLERRDTVSRPVDVWPAWCRPPRRWAAADRQATYRRVGKRYSDLVEVMRPIRMLQWRARCSAKAEGLPTPR